MGPLVVDASVMAALYLEEAGTAPAKEALMRAYASNLDLHAPDLLLVETANVMWKRVRRGELDHESAVTAINDLSSLEDLHLHSIGGRLVRRALNVALSHELTAYDALYVALAADLGDGVLLSIDRRLVSRAAEAGFQALEPSEFIAAF